MKMKKLFFGLFACASLCACSNDESGVIPDDTPKVFTGDEAYINVRLADAGSLTRAQEGEFEYGTNEQSVFPYRKPVGLLSTATIYLG